MKGKEFFLILVIFFFSVSVFSFSQTSTDSLKKVVQEKKEKREKKEKEALASEKKVASTTTASYLKIGADPQDLHRNIELDEMLIRYDGDLLVVTASGSGKKSTGLIRTGEPLIIKKGDFAKGEIIEFVILQCGNDTKITTRGKTKSIKPLDMGRVIPIKIAGRDNIISADSTKKDAGTVASVASDGTIFRVVPEEELKGMLKDFFEEYSSKNGTSFPVQKESSFSPWPYIVLGIVALAAGTYVVVRALDKVPDAKSNVDSGGSGNGNGNGNGGPVDPPSNGPVRYPVGLRIGFSL